MRNVEEVILRCKPILNQPSILLIVEKASSPSSTYELVMESTGCGKTAKAARWLAVLKRDYPLQYKQVLGKTTFDHNEGVGS